MKLVQHPTETAFLSDICCNPADDSVRLIYADWLDDRGLSGDSKRAEFIRGQMALCCFPLATAGDIPRDCPDEHLCYRLKWRVHHEDYPFVVPDWTETPADSWSWYGHGPQFAIQCGYYSNGYFQAHYPFTLHWRRGFIEGISLSLVDFRKCAARLFAGHPVQDVLLTDRQPADRHNLGLQWYYWDEKGPWPLPQDFQAIREALPRVLYDFLPPGKVYESAAAAHRDLSLACVRWGRQQAGLLEGGTP